MYYLSSIWRVLSTMGSIIARMSGETLPFSIIFLIAALINIPTLLAIYGRKKSRDE